MATDDSSNQGCIGARCYIKRGRAIRPRGENKTQKVIVVTHVYPSLQSSMAVDVSRNETLLSKTQVTGVISMKDPTKKKKKKRKKAGREGSLRARISETISDTLRRAGRRKKTSVRCDIPNFLFVNKPHFSSDESLADQRWSLFFLDGSSLFSCSYPQTRA